LLPQRNSSRGEKEPGVKGDSHADGEQQPRGNQRSEPKREAQIVITSEADGFLPAIFYEPENCDTQLSQPWLTI
jgi:hypothetical protein